MSLVTRQTLSSTPDRHYFTTRGCNVLIQAFDARCNKYRPQYPANKASEQKYTKSNNFNLAFTTSLATRHQLNPRPSPPPLALPIGLEENHEHASPPEPSSTKTSRNKFRNHLHDVLGDPPHIVVHPRGPRHHGTLSNISARRNLSGVPPVPPVEHTPQPAEPEDDGAEDTEGAEQDRGYETENRCA